MIEIDQKDWDTDLTEDKLDDVLGVTCPYSKISYLILYLYSMELGHPQLYAEVNRVSRQKDYYLLEYLGPYIQTLCKIIQNGEMNKRNNDKILTGEILGGVPENMLGTFIVWRGSQMKSEWIKPYVEFVKK